MIRARLRTLVVAQPALASRVDALAEGLGLELLDRNAARGPRPLALAVHELHASRQPIGLNDVAAVQAIASEWRNALVVIVAPVGIDAYTRSAMRRAGAFEVVLDEPDFEDDFSGLTHVARRVTRLETERENLVGELAHRDRMSTVGLLAAGVAHEINNPVAAILVNTETIRGDVEQVLALPRFQQGEALQQRSGEWLEALGDTIGASRRISSIVRSLNVFSRRADETTAPVPTDLNAEVNTVLRLVGKEVRLQSGVSLTLGADVPEVLAPPFALTQVVTNLVVNALHALEASIPNPADRRLHIETASDGHSVLLQITDNGSGISPEVLGRIFDPFFTTKPAGAGTGLGLSITRELVHRCGGEVFVESEVGKGATFRIVLPIAHDATDRVRPISQAPPAMLRHRVLIVDDDEALLRAMTRSLAAQLECIAETSGAAAIARVRAGEHFDAILLDVVMPGIDGMDTWRAIGALSPGLALRTVFFSGGVRGDDRISALHATGQPVLPKPTEVAKILAALRAVSSASVPGRSAVAGPALVPAPPTEQPAGVLQTLPLRRR